MLAYKILSLIFWLVAIPFCMGLLLLPFLYRKYRTMPVALLGGYILMFALLELVGIPVVFFAVYNGFTTFIKCYTPVLAVCALLGIWVTYLRMRKGYELNFRIFPAFGRTSGESVLFMLLFLALLGFQLYMAFTRASFDGDDAYYGVQALTAQQIDSFYRVNPYTGRSSPLDVRHALALFPIWEAFVASMSDIHATIVCHSVIPLALIPLSYLLWYQTGKSLFVLQGPDQKDYQQGRALLPMFLALMALWQMFGAVSIYTPETFFLTRTWQGKSFTGNFVIPAVMWIFLCLFEQGPSPRAGAAPLKLKEGWKVRESGKSIMKQRRESCQGQAGFWILLACLNLAGGASSSLAVLLSCMLTMGFGFLFALRHRSPAILCRAAASCVPGGVYVLVYVALTHGILVF